MSTRLRCRPHGQSRILQRILRPARCARFPAYVGRTSSFGKNRFGNCLLFRLQPRLHFLSESRLAEIFLELQEKGSANINLVTAVHFVPHVIKALDLAKINGLSIPVIYNSSGYESVDTLRRLSGYIDVYLPDYKYRNSDLARRFSSAYDYPAVAEKAIEEMVSQVGNCVFDKNGMMKRGVIVRHLVLPKHTDDSMAVLEYLHNTYGDRIYISIMNQYTPVRKYEKYPELSRKLTTYEYEKVVKFAQKIGIRNGFLQSGEAAKESFIPSFDGLGI